SHDLFCPPGKERNMRTFVISSISVGIIIYTAAMAVAGHGGIACLTAPVLLATLGLFCWGSSYHSEDTSDKRRTRNEVRSIAIVLLLIEVCLGFVGLMSVGSVGVGVLYFLGLTAVVMAEAANGEHNSDERATGDPKARFQVTLYAGTQPIRTWVACE